MSQVDSATQLRAVVGDNEITFFVSVAATALVIYEHLITFEAEVQQIWRRDMTVTSILFILTRYITLANRVVVMVSLSPLLSLESCAVTLWVEELVTSALLVVLASIAAIRVYALWNRDIRCLAIVFATALVLPIMNLYLRSTSTFYLIPSAIYTCQSIPTDISTGIYKSLRITEFTITVAVVSRVMAIASDGIVVILTWVKTYRIHKIVRRANIKADLSMLFLRDGTLYFGSILFLNLITIGYIWIGTGTNVIGDLVTTMSSILMSRFLLNLRNRFSVSDTMTDQGEIFDTTLANAAPESIVFGTMGGSVGMVDNVALDPITDTSGEADDGAEKGSPSNMRRPPRDWDV